MVRHARALYVEGQLPEYARLPGTDLCEDVSAQVSEVHLSSSRLQKPPKRENCLENCPHNYQCQEGKHEKPEYAAHKWIIPWHHFLPMACLTISNACTSSLESSPRMWRNSSIGRIAYRAVRIATICCAAAVGSLITHSSNTVTSARRAISSFTLILLCFIRSTAKLAILARRLSLAGGFELAEGYSVRVLSHAPLASFSRETMAQVRQPVDGKSPCFRHLNRLLVNGMAC